jgi:hypothetical protein
MPKADLFNLLHTSLEYDTLQVLSLSNPEAAPGDVDATYSRAFVDHLLRCFNLRYFEPLGRHQFSKADSRSFHHNFQRRSPDRGFITTTSGEGRLGWSEVACPAAFPPRFSTLDLSNPFENTWS